MPNPIARHHHGSCADGCAQHDRLRGDPRSRSQDFSFKPEISSHVEIGDDNVIREYATIHRATKEGGATRLGNNNFLMVGVHLGHDSSVANRVVIANNCLLAGHVEVQDGAVLGGGSVFHQFLRVGRLCMVRGGERFNKDVPPFVSAYGTSLVSGINAIGLKRAGFSSETRMEIKKAFKLVYREGFNISQSIEESKKQTWDPRRSTFSISSPRPSVAVSVPSPAVEDPQQPTKSSGD